MMQRQLAVAIAIAALGIGACIIGPKQDDPASAAPTNESGDIASDATTDAAVADTSAPADAGFSADAVPLPRMDASGDASDAADASDGACADGGVRLDAIGPWNETKTCWETTTHTFECVDGPDGGTRFTCFARISTGELFLAPSTQIPVGPDYRACKDTEGGSPFLRCK